MYFFSFETEVIKRCVKIVLLVHVMELKRIVLAELPLQSFHHP
ncbi:hypothetical protein protein [Bacillus cereus G9241]|nr:hypothetical protein protein [Bacillus cereus G9241]